MQIRPIFGNTRPLFYQAPPMSRSPYLNIERQTVAQEGGNPNLRLDGPDGTVGLSRRPVEVKYASQGRFRVGDKDHRRMRAVNGLYIFVTSDGRKIKLGAEQVEKLLRYRGLSDLRKNGVDYRHSFLFQEDLPQQ